MTSELSRKFLLFRLIVITLFVLSSCASTKNIKRPMFTKCRVVYDFVVKTTACLCRTHYNDGNYIEHIVDRNNCPSEVSDWVMK